MNKNGKKLRRHRKFTKEFKLQLVKEYETGKHTVQELHKLYELSPTSIYGWIYQFSKINKKSVVIVEMKDSQTQKLNELTHKVKELEQAVGQKQIYIDYLEKMIELANTELEIDIKKNSNTPHSGGFKTTEKN